MKQTLQERLRNRSFRLATRDLNGDGAKLAIEAADALDLAEKALDHIANIENGPDNGSSQWRATASANIARTALKAIKGVE